jgi:cytoskeletal protein RodZ
MSESLPPEAKAAPEAKVPIWSQVLSIVVIVAVASWYLLSERRQERAEAPADGKARSAQEEPDPQAHGPEAAEEPPTRARAAASAAPSEPDGEPAPGGPGPE